MVFHFWDQDTLPSEVYQGISVDALSEGNYSGLVCCGLIDFGVKVLWSRVQIPTAFLLTLNYESVFWFDGDACQTSMTLLSSLLGCLGVLRQLHLQSLLYISSLRI
jgi:hypothetical protein